MKTLALGQSLHHLRPTLTILIVGLSASVVAGQQRERQVIQDNHFRRGLVLWEPKPGKHVRYGVLPGFDKESKPIWGLSQWSSKFPLGPAEAKPAADGSLHFSNLAKSIRFAPPRADLLLAVNSAVEYGPKARSDGEPWIHLLLEQEFEAPPLLHRLSAAKFGLSARLLRSVNCHDHDYDPGRHAAQFQVFFTIQNRNQRSSGHGDLLWFGIPIYDSRHRQVPEFKSKDFGGTEKFIFTPAGTTFTSESAHDGTWIKIDRDLLPLIQEALELAWAKGFLIASRNFPDYAIGGMNIGWEVPGTFEVELEIRDLSLIVTEAE